MKRSTQGALVLIAAAVVSQAYRPGNLGPIVVAGVLVGVNVLGAQWLSTRRTRPSPSTKSFVVPLGICWLLVGPLSAHEFSYRSGTQAVSTIALEPMIDFAVFGAVGVVSVLTIRMLEPDFQRARPPIFMFLIPIWVMCSTFWGLFGAYSMARGLQYLAIAALAWATVALGRHDPTAVKAVVGIYLRWFVLSTAALTMAGAMWGQIYTPSGVHNLDRFSWIGAHPNGAGIVLSVAIVILVSTPPRVLKLPPLAVPALTVAFLVALFFNHSRTAWACLAAGLGIVLVLQGKIRPKMAAIAFPLVGAVTTAAMWINGTAIWDYILREGDSESLRTGNGRIKLWGIGFRALDTAFDWLVGIGYGASRTVFRAEVSWATSAHNSTLSYLVSLGVIGLGLFLYTVFFIGRTLLRDRVWSEPEVGVPMSALFVIMVINSLATDILAEPELGFASLYLVGVAGIVAGMSGGFSPGTDAETGEPDGAEGAGVDVPDAAGMVATPGSAALTSGVRTEAGAAGASTFR